MVRLASTAGHDQHDDHHGHGDSAGNETYGPETFFSPIWRNTILTSLVVYGVYTYLPDPSDPDTKNIVTKFIAEKLKTPAETWMGINELHTKLCVYTAEGKQVSEAAQRPVMHRYKFPSMLDQYSQHLSLVGMDVDVSNTVVKREGQ